MKIVIPINEKCSLNDKIALHFGRANNFLIYDTETESFEIFPNPEVAGGKEFPPDFLYRQGVKAVIVFSLGAMAYKKFKNYNIKMYKAVEDTVLKNLQKVEGNELKELKNKDIF
ncbi:hypothetical protein COX73_02725 [bacterium (Candidatus Gribaldobacteria) CG_4_10_14_0_2_um_filter_36_18]|uniref:Dinitrogenase iron-molybdenum cofactor biosynthesis domain-containing protein n=1 Tax=bacterium (Candidatus Gribaldobacteria) CG_4_10_14_0_2_um_filter_36_18 TaxID=2014264 RepID=A0A2M7VJP1_9BACT|nr:MAG: hypothetical protein COX73_02725 [bacterium (Candidatus Gribaldobacteria) CG_4_10_14_0_2_um_filter_36_18]